MVDVGLSLLYLNLLTIRVVNELYAEGTADKILDFFLKEEKGFGKVHQGREADAFLSLILLFPFLWAK